MEKNIFTNVRDAIQIIGVFTVGLLFCGIARAQDATFQFPFGNRAIPERVNITLPVSRGATVWSTYLHGYAANRLAAGSYLESRARANLINGHARLAHIEADRVAVKYHVERLTAFFDLRRMNKEYRREINPLPHERDTKADEVMDDLITDQPEYVLKNLDITGRLNWMFVRLTNRLYSDELLNNTEIFGGEKFSQELSRFQTQQIYLESTERIDGQRIRTPLVDTNSGHQKLPPAFSMPALRGAADRYIVNRHNILNALKDEKTETPSFEQWEAIYSCLDGLERSLSVAIPPDDRSIPRLLDYYLSGRRFIKSQAAAMMFVHRTGRGDQFIGGDVFEGQTIGELLNFMVHRGLQFGRPETGGRSSYETLFRMLRAAYMYK